MSDFIRLDRAERIQQIVINRPEKKNALDLSMYGAIASAIREADADPQTRVSVISGVDGVFCSGNDVQDFLKNPPTGADSPALNFIDSLVHAKKPLLAAVDGIAVGVGVTLLLHCDLVFASDRATFQLPFVNIGLCPEAGSTFNLPALFGYQRAAELVMLGREFDATEAATAGMVNRVVPHGELSAVVMQTAEKLAAQPPDALRTTKALLRAAWRDLLQAAIERENPLFLQMVMGEEAKEALTAFMEKRPADFSRFR